MRAVIHMLAIGLFGQSRSLATLPRRPEIVGLGLTDPHCYAEALAAKFAYTNTRLHVPPFLDICAEVGDRRASADFLIASDVFEHIMPPVQRAFDNAWQLLKPGGVFAFSVPWGESASTHEHYPNALQIAPVQHRGEWVVLARNKDGSLTLHENPIFHGGAGFTVEMRLFCRSALVDHFARAGFVDIEFMECEVPQFGIFYTAWSRPLVARKPAHALG